MKKILTASALLLAVASSALANTIPEVEKIKEKYQAEYAQLQADIQQWQASQPEFEDYEQVLGVSFEVDMELEDFSFDIPEVRMKTEEFSLDLPQFKMERTSFSMHVPEVRMVLKKVGEYPCFKGWKWYSCDIKTKVPEVHMKHKKMSFDYPKVWWGRTSFKMDIPVFNSKRVEIKMHIPKFKLVDPKDEMNSYSAAGETFAARGKQLAQAQKADIQEAVKSSMAAKRESISSKFNDAIIAIDKAIGQTRKAGADPSKLNGENGVINLISMRDAIISQREEALAAFDKQIANLRS